MDEAAAQAAQKEKEAAEAALKKELGDIEIKSGDYQIQVHIIECRELAGKDGDGLSDPVCVVECFGEKQSTKVLPKALNCVFDELLIFNFRDMDKDKFEEGVVSIKVNNANFVMKTDLIGAYVFDACSVYYKKDHELYRTWVALMNDEDPECVGVQGYLKCSVQIVGPGDKLKIHDEEEEMRKEKEMEKTNAGDMSSLCLMPPSIKKEWKYLVCTVYRAEYLPVMDLALGIKKTDAFVQLEFGSAKRLRTKVRTVKGNRSAMNPRFNFELWCPVSCPTMTQTIKVSVWDNDATGNELIATCYEKFNIIEKAKGKTGVKWVNLYGAPEATGVAVSNMLGNAINTVGKITGEDFKETYNTYPDRASTYKGRLLVAYSIQTERPVHFEKKLGPKIEGFRRVPKKKLTISQEPPTRQCVLKAIIASGTELPTFTTTSKLQVRVSCGANEALSKYVTNNKGLCEWCELVSTEEFDCPVDLTQCPDIIVHLCKGGEGHAMQPICFARIKATELFNQQFSEPATWIALKEDKSINALSDGVFPGQVLLKLGFGEIETANQKQKEWKNALDRLNVRRPYQVRVHLYQGADLPAADSNGLLDPKIKVNFMGQSQTDGKKIEMNRYPLYYTSLNFDVLLPDIEFAPQVNVQLYDVDLLSIKDEYLGNFCFNLNNAYTLDDLSAPLPDPIWNDFYIEEPGDGAGKLLMSCQLIPKSTPDYIPPVAPSLEPAKKTAYLEVIALGIRNMAPFNFQAMTSPFLEIEYDSFGHKEIVTTEASKKPNPNDPNFLQRLVFEVQLPDNALFATPLHLRARDTRLGGYMKPVVGVGTIELQDKIPWSKTYKEPQTDEFFSNPIEAQGLSVEALAAGEVGFNGVVEKKKDSTAIKIQEMKEKRMEEKDADDFVLTQEPLSVEGFLRSRVNNADTGAGVFGALSHLALPEYGGKRKAKALNDFFTAVDFDEEEEVGPPKYMINRETHMCELEEVLKTTPFETYPLTRGQVNGMFGSTLKTVGKFKGLIRVMMAKDEPPLIDLESLLKPQGYKVRLYALKANNLTAMDIGIGGRPGKSDPYLKVKLGKQTFDDRANAIDDVTDADFYQMIELNAELPGTSQLIVSVMDKDTIGSDDLIGRTIIDLEDRWFDGRWQKLGRENRIMPTDDPNHLRWDTKPLETRSLYAPTSNNAQGNFTCWLDILTPAEANAFPPDDVALPPRQIFEMRVVIWKAKDVPAQDTFGGQNMTDMYVQVRPEGCAEQTTDTHWRAKKGKGSFNWRMLFDVELGHNTRSMKFPYLSLQLWDKDLLKYNDCICESTFDMRKFYEKAYRKNCAVKLFEKKKGAALQREKEKKARDRLYNIPDTEEDIPSDEDEEDEPDRTINPMVGGAAIGGSPARKGVTGGRSDKFVEAADSDDELDGDTGVGVTGMKTKDLAAGSAEAARNKAAQQEAEKVAAAKARKQKKEDQQKAKAEARAATGDDATEEESVAEEEEPPLDADAQETEELIVTIKNLTGLFDIDPPDSTWIHMDRLNHETGIRDPMGSLCFSIQLWPKDKAVVMPQGAAREDPNSDPYCPPPVGRISFSWNPFYMMLQLCGPSLMAKFLCCIICLGILALMIFCQPALNLLIALFC